MKRVELSESANDVQQYIPPTRDEDTSKINTKKLTTRSPFPLFSDRWIKCNRHSSLHTAMASCRVLKRGRFDGHLVPFLGSTRKFTSFSPVDTCIYLSDQQCHLGHKSWISMVRNMHSIIKCRSHNVEAQKRMHSHTCTSRISTPSDGLRRLDSPLR